MNLLERVSFSADPKAVKYEHPQGLLDVDGKRYIHVSTGERSTLKKPFVTMHLFESIVGNRNKGANLDASTYWGTFKVPNDIKSPIRWQQHVEPMVFVDEIKRNGGPIDVDFFLTKRVSIEPKDWAYFENMSKYEFLDKVDRYGITLQSMGKFVTIPDRKKQYAFLEGVEMSTFNIEGSGPQNQMTTFVYAEDLLTLDSVVETFIAKQTRIPNFEIFRKLEGTGKQVIGSVSLRERRIVERRKAAKDAATDPRNFNTPGYGNNAGGGIQEPNIGNQQGNTELSDEAKDIALMDKLNEGDPAGWTAEQKSQYENLMARSEARKKGEAVPALIF